METFNILEKNIKINSHQDKVKCFNFALSDNASPLLVQSFSDKNIGGNAYCENKMGDTQAFPLDDIMIDEKINFMKIDVEGMEMKVLSGAQNTIKRYCPIIFIEAFSDTFDKVNAFMYGINYKKIKAYHSSNYLYGPIKN